MSNEIAKDAPTIPAATAAGTNWWSRLSSKQKLSAVVGGSVLSVIAGVTGAKYFTASPGSARAEAPVAEVKKEEPKKPLIDPDGELPSIVAPPTVKKTEPDGSDLDIPSVTPVTSAKDEKKAKPTKGSNLTNDPDELVLKPVVVEPKTKAAPEPGKKAVDEPDDFIAPPIPSPAAKKSEEEKAISTDTKSRTDRVKGPVLLQAGAKEDADIKPPSDKKPAADDLPEIPVLDLDGTAKKKTDAKSPTKKAPDPEDLPKVTAPKLKKDDPKTIDDDGVPAIPATPILGPLPSPKIEKPVVVPEAPKITVPSFPEEDKEPAKLVSPPSRKAELPPKIQPMAIDNEPATTIPTLPARPAETPAPKKDSYDEDWHTHKPGDTYAMISREYYKTTDYAASLEAYNKERFKPGDPIIRVPPVWVLEEKFPGMANTRPERTAVTEPKPSTRFEPVEPATTKVRPAPVSVVNAESNEYVVRNEQGETIREVARKVLGNANDWKRLYTLNPDIDPTVPIPVGTMLRLPR